MWTLQSEIEFARHARMERNISLITQGGPNNKENEPELSTDNLAKESWILRASPPFLETDLRDLAEKWQPRANDLCFQRITSLYRFIFLQVTSPPQEIQQYAVRLNGRSARDTTLQNLPKNVENTLIDFVEDLLGFGEVEIRAGRVANKETSSFYIELGSNEAQRNAKFKQLCKDRLYWRPWIFKGLQKALRDVRAYSCEDGATEFKWIPSTKQAKRPRPDYNTENDVDENEDIDVT